MLIIFSHHQENESPAAAHLVYKPDVALVKALEDFIQARVFDTNDGKSSLLLVIIIADLFISQLDPDGNKSNIEILHRRRHFLSAFCKLIVYNVIPIKHAACVIKHYVKVGDCVAMAKLCLLIYFILVLQRLR